MSTTAKPAVQKDTLDKIILDEQAIAAVLADVEGDVSEGAAEVIDAWFAEIEERKAEKVDGYAFRIKAEQAEAAHLKALAAEITAKANAAENRAAWLQRRMEAHMEINGLEVMAGKVWNFKFQKHGGKVPLVLQSENPEDYPADCVVTVTTTTINKERVRERLEEGLDTWKSDLGEVPLPAHLGERGRSLRLR